MTREYNNNYPADAGENDQRELIKLLDEKIMRLGVQHGEQPSPSVLIELAEAVQCRFVLGLVERGRAGAEAGNGAARTILTSIAA